MANIFMMNSIRVPSGGLWTVRHATTTHLTCRLPSKRALQRVPAPSKRHISTGNVFASNFTPSKEAAALRAEAEAPFRSLRITLFGFSFISAVLANLFGLPPLIAALGHAANAKPLTESLTDLAINLTALAVTGYLTKSDLDAREKQIARLMREETLGACRLELANGKVMQLISLRSFARVVLVAGSAEQVQAAIDAAVPYKDKLVERGVLVVGLPIFGGGGGNELLSKVQSEDLRWRATAIRLNEWKAWFTEQAGMAGKGTEKGLYVSLRLDGRVRGSGSGAPPWGVLAAQLPPTEGFFGGLFDGMDGKV